MKQVTLREVRQGDFFTLRPIEEPKESQVYIREDYDRSERKYWVSKFSDMNAGRFMNGSKKVFVDFTF